MAVLEIINTGYISYFQLFKVLKKGHDFPKPIEIRPHNQTRLIFSNPGYKGHTLLSHYLIYRLVILLFHIIVSFFLVLTCFLI